MRELFDEHLINQFLDEYKIPAFFDSQNVKFHLFQYEKGNMILGPSNTSNYIHFVIRGTISIYSIREDGSEYYISSVDSKQKLVVLGDIEFVKNTAPPFFSEANTDVLTISINSKETNLKNDNTFLWLLLESLTDKIGKISIREANFSNIEEKLIHLIATSPDKKLTQIEQVAFQLHCSNRHLIRVLQKLTDEKKIIKIDKGIYGLHPET